MTRKDFILIAETIRNMPSHAASLRAQRESCASAFADRLQRENDRFNRELFIQAATGVVAVNARKAVKAQAMDPAEAEAMERGGHNIGYSVGLDYTR